MVDIPAEAWEKTYNARPQYVYNAGMELGGNAVTIRKLLLDKITYPAAGIPLDFQTTCLRCVCEGKMWIGSRGPDGCEIECPPISAWIECDAVGNGKLKFYQNGAEVAAGWTGPAGSYIWLEFLGGL